MARRRDLVEILDDHEKELRRMKATLARVANSGVTEHDLLNGLADDDHPQYLLAATHAADPHSDYLPLTGGELSGPLTIIGSVEPTLLLEAAVPATEVAMVMTRTDYFQGWIGERSDETRLFIIEGSPTEFLYLGLYNTSGATLRKSINMDYDASIFGHADQTTELRGTYILSEEMKIKGALSDTQRGGQLRLSYDGYPNSMLVRMTDAAFYFLLTDTEDGTWNAKRPFTITNSTGRVTIGNGLTVSSIDAFTAEGSIMFDGTGTGHALGWDSDTQIYSTGDGNITMRTNAQVQLSIDTAGTTETNLFIAPYFRATSRKFSFGTQGEDNDYIEHDESLNFYKFISDGDTTHYIAISDSNSQDTGQPSIYWLPDAPTSSATQYDAYFRNNITTGRAELFRYSSSARYKQEIEDYENPARSALDFVMALRPITYRDKAEAASGKWWLEESLEVGLIAEEVAAIEPHQGMFAAFQPIWPMQDQEITHGDGTVEIVSVPVPDSEPIDFIPEAVNYKLLTIPLIKVAQLHEQRIQTMWADMTAMKQRIKALEGT